MRLSWSICFIPLVLLLGTTGCGMAAEPDGAASSATDSLGPIATSGADAGASVYTASSGPLATDVATTTTAPTAQPTEPQAWPTAVQAPPSDCVDSRSQLAPTLIPDGWQRFVLQAQPTGTCGQHPFLMMSLVLAGTSAVPGTLVTILISPASGAIAQLGEPVVVNGHQGSLVRSTMGDGTATVSISVFIDPVAVEAHGNADESQLRDIVASIRPIDDLEWAALVGSVQGAG